MTSTRLIKQSLLEESRREVLCKYSRFTLDLDKQLKLLHQENFSYLSTNPQNVRINISDQQRENTNCDRLLQTCGNEQICKVISVLTGLCKQMDQLREEALNQCVRPLAMYRVCDFPLLESVDPVGEHPLWQRDQNCDFLHSSQDDSKEGNDQFEEFYALLPIFTFLLRFVKDVQTISHNVILQLHSLSKSKPITNSSFAIAQEFVDLFGVRFDLLFQSLFSLIGVVVNIDELLKNQHQLKEDFFNFKKLIELNTLQVVTESRDKQLKLLLTFVQHLEKEVFGGQSFFHQLVKFLTTQPMDLEQITKNQLFAEQMAAYIRTVLCEMEHQPLHSSSKWIEIYSLFVVYTFLFRKDDKRLYKLLLETQKRFNVVCIHLEGNVTMFPEMLFIEHLPKSFAEKRNFDSIVLNRELLLKQSLMERVNQLFPQLIRWSSRAQKVLTERQKIEKTNWIHLMPAQISTLEEGVRMAQQAFTLARTHIYLHVHYAKPMSKVSVLSICKLVILIKSVQLFYSRNKTAILQTVLRYVNFCCYTLLKLYANIRSRLIADVRKYSEKRLDILSTLILSSNCLHGPNLTFDRQTIVSLCNSIIAKALNDDETKEIQHCMSKIRTSAFLYRLLDEFTDCAFFYANVSLLEVFFSFHVDHELETVNEIKYIFHSLSDYCKNVPTAMNEQLTKKLCLSYQQHVWSLFKTHYLDKLCEKFETELRFQIHDELQLDDPNPFKRSLLNFQVVFDSEPIFFFDRLISIRTYVQNHLNEIAYKLTSIALHDWRTYELMRSLAAKRYGFEFVRSQLPTQTIEQGLDVLQITREMERFVTEYAYNLNNQLFVQRPATDRPQLNSLQIIHVSNSLKTHGLGIVNTAVNYTYRFLKKKLGVFSKFLYEEHIKFRLMKELRDFRDSSQQHFPYERAEKLVKAIQKLGYVRNKNTFLDEFRLLVTEMGNALGLVRMLRNGALNYCAGVANRVPELDDLYSLRFLPLCEEDEFDGECQRAAAILDDVLDGVSRNFTDASDYFGLLVRVFRPLLDERNSSHLSQFFVILPALTLNYVQHMLLSKERLSRKSTTSAMFTDDGFVMGLAYLLRLLDQWNSFESLHWFDSVQQHQIQLHQQFVQEASRVSDRAESEKIAQTSALTSKRLAVFVKEFNLLHYNLVSCKVLFRCTEFSNNVANEGTEFV